MNKEELEHKLDQARIDRTNTDKGFILEIESLKQRIKQFSEAEKPKLRLKDWDYGHSTADIPYIVINNKIMWLREGEYSKEYEPTSSAFTKTFQGHNLADDLKAMSEPREDFTTGNGMIVRFEAGNLHFSCQYVLASNIHDFILNLRRMEAFAKSKA